RVFLSAQGRRKARQGAATAGENGGGGKQKGHPGAPLLLTEMERARRFERPTLTLARLCSTPELRPHRFGEAVFRPGGRRAQGGRSRSGAVSLPGNFIRRRAGAADQKAK